MDDELREGIAGSWAEFQEALAALDGEAAMQPGRAGTWSAADIVAHVLGWHVEARERLAALADGSYERRQYDFDQFNAGSVARLHGMAWEPLVAELAASHEALVAYAASLPAELWARDKRVAGWLHAVTDEHYHEHLEQLRGAPIAPAG